MPPKTTIKYIYEKYVIEGRTYKIPANCTPGSRRFKWWMKWQDRGLKLPDVEPKVDIQSHGVLPFTPFEQYMKAAA